MKLLRVMAFVLTLVSLSGGVAVGQVLYGTLVGNVTDPQQAAVVGAQVTIKNLATNYAVEAKSDDRGAYELRNLPPGNYDIKITATGFVSFEAKEVVIAANNIARVNAALKIGAVTEVITVGAEVAAMQTDRSDIHTDITAKQLSQITIPGYRNFQALIDLLPGTTPSAFQNASTDTPARALTTNVNGTARNSNNTRIDGAASIYTWLPHHAFYIPPLESIETVNISTNNFDAEQGMSGGAAVSVISKSGTNRFHGVGFAYHANHKWGAKNLFFNPNTPAGTGTPQRLDNQYGGTFGGPIKKDKLFFFASWEGTTTAERGNGLLSVPTAAVRNGNFAGLTTVYNPTTGNAAGQNRTPFDNNVIPESMKSAAARILVGYVPLPNTGTSQLTNFFAAVPYYFKRDNVDGKLNWTPNGKTNIFAKYSVMISPVTSGVPLGQALGPYPGGAAGAAGIGTGYNHTDVFGAGISYIISPTLLVDANFGGTFMHHTTTGPDYGTNIGLDVLRIPGTNGPDIRQSGFPIFNITGYTSIGNVNNWSPIFRNDWQYTYAANMNWTKGAHNIRFGFDFVDHQMNHWQPEFLGGPRGTFNFVEGVTSLSGGVASGNNFNAYAAFLLGLPGSMNKAYQFYDPMRTREFHQGYYVRDNWQVNRKLSVNLGLRMEHFPIPDRGEFGLERYDLETNKMLVGGRGNVPRNAGTTAQTVMFAPRVGLAYRVNDGTVLRAGFGITSDPYPLSRPLRSPFPAIIGEDHQPLNAFSPAGSLATGIPAPRFPDLSTGIVDIPNNVGTTSLQGGKYRRGYIESFNVTIQRDLGWGFVIQTSYVGTRSIRQGVNYFEANAGLVPGAGAAGRPLFARYGVNAARQFYIPMAHQRYDAWQSNVTRRLSGGLFLSSSYTWSKTLGITAGNSDSGLRFYVPSQFSKNRTLADFDRKHSWTSAATYELPFGKGKTWATTGPAAMLTGGWQVNPAVFLYSGTPFSVTTSGASLNAPNNTQVADQINADVRKIGAVGVDSPFYDATPGGPGVLGSFATVNQPRFGNMALNALRGPRLFDMGLGLFRSFKVRESWNLQFRAEALNVTNTPRLNNPNATVSTPSNFMQITGAGATQRTIRFGLRFAY